MTTILTPDADHQYGISEYEALVGGCLRRHFLQERPPAGVTDGSVSAEPTDADYGTAVHSWLAAYHLGHATESLPVMSDIAPPNGGCSAATLVTRYAKKVPQIALGVPCIVETRLRTDFEVSPGRYEPLAGTLDWVADLKEHDCQVIRDTWGVDLEPGRYLVDHKTKKSHPGCLFDIFAYSSQFTAYHVLYNAYSQTFEDDTDALKGTLVNILFRYIRERDDQFKMYLIHPPDEQAMAVLRGIVREGTDRLQMFGPNHCTPTRCFDFYRPCEGLSDCPRHQ